MTSQPSNGQDKFGTELPALPRPTISEPGYELWDDAARVEYGLRVRQHIVDQFRDSNLDFARFKFSAEIKPPRWLVKSTTEISGIEYWGVTAMLEMGKIYADQWFDVFKVLLEGDDHTDDQQKDAPPQLVKVPVHPKPTARKMDQVDRYNAALEHKLGELTIAFVAAATQCGIAVPDHSVMGLTMFLNDLVEDSMAAERWRTLALQFDGHRMAALGHLKMMLVDPVKHGPVVTEFLAAPPLSGEEVLAERIAALASKNTGSATVPIHADGKGLLDGFGNHLPPLPQHALIDQGVLLYDNGKVMDYARAITESTVLSFEDRYPDQKVAYPLRAKPMLSQNYATINGVAYWNAQEVELYGRYWSMLLIEDIGKQYTDFVRAPK